MILLNTDILFHIGKFLTPQDVVELSYVNKELRENSDYLLRSQYQKTFGKRNGIYELDIKIITRLLCLSGRQPDLTINYNIYKSCSIEDVQDVYNRSINLLENTQPISIIQLKNKLLGFWHLDRQIKDYANASSLEIGKDLMTRSDETYAKIGEFSLDGKDYDVVAHHRLADENADHPMKKRITKFWSTSYGKTEISFFERNKDQAETLSKIKILNTSIFHSYHTFSIYIGRKHVNTTQVVFEGGDEPVLNSKRILVCDTGFAFQNRTFDDRGSDRLLDQKLIQIAIEIMMQNKKIIHLKVQSNYDQLVVLATGGFKNSLSSTIMEELISFRSDEKNKLFPPYKDYGNFFVAFKMEDFTEPVVHFSKGSPESWEDIIQRKPILTEKSGILPEYWVVKPNIVDENI